MNTPRIRKNSIPFWRIVFTLLIIMLHSGYTEGGYIGVEFFFLVSGFLLAKSYYGDKLTSVKQYVQKRILRLYPMYLLSIVIFIALLSTLDFTSSDFTIREYFVNVLDNIVANWRSVLMLQLFGDGAIIINSPAWYVVALFWVALIYYILMKVLPKKAFVVVVTVTSVAVLVCCFIFIGHLDLWENKTLYVSQGVFRAYAEIGLGILIYIIKEALEKKIRINKKAALVVELIGYIAVLVAITFTKHTRLDFVLLMIMALCVLLSFTEHKGAFFHNKVVTTISGYTYGTYMNHSVFVVLLMIFAVPFDNLPQLLKLLWILLAAAVTGVVSENVIRLIMKKLSKLDKKTVYNTIFISAMSVLWIFCLRDIRGSLLTYIVIGIVSIAMCVSSHTNIDKRSVRTVVCLLSLLLSGLITLAHYYVFNGYSTAVSYGMLIAMLVSGFFVFYYIFKFGYVRLKDYTFKTGGEYKISPRIIFIVACLIFVIINTLILVLCKYPTDYFYDSLWQLGEIKTSSYTNHHSVYHTWILEQFCRLGYYSGIGLGNALFLYTLCQIVIVGLIVGYYIKTLYEMKAPIILIILSYAFMVFNPISLKYATFVDKDQLYTYLALLFLLSLTRIIVGIGNAKRSDWVYMVIGGLGFGLFRGNGFVILVASMIVAVIMKTEVRKKLIITFASLAAIVFILNTPLRIALDVKPTEFSESLSIPIQQVSRVVYDGCELTDEERNMVFTLIEEDVIKKDYKPHISDNMKGIIQIHRRDDYFKENIADYIKLYIKLGLRYPGEYIKAWVDQTYGYYAPGYGNTSLYFEPCSPEGQVWVDIIYEIEGDRRIIAPRLVDLLNGFAKLFENNPILYQFLEIGGLVYLTLYMLVIKIWKRSKTSFIEAAGLITVATLLIATPLATSIRYTYLIFLTVYLSVATAFYKPKEEASTDVLDEKTK